MSAPSGQEPVMSDGIDQKIREQIGHRIKVRRAEPELRQQDFADRLGVTQNHTSE